MARIPAFAPRSVLCFVCAIWTLLAAVLAQECSATNACKIGCCSKFGFCGLGPDYCGSDICVNNCDRKAECDPGGYGEAFVEKTVCPLNVCCSKYGFCGMTEEFCGKSTLDRPKCTSDKEKGFKRVVGYYEGWSLGRPCNTFYPEQIPRNVYTHINFAFASIDPATFALIPASNADKDLYHRLAALKAKDNQLKIMIAVGGWTFNDPGPTSSTFSDISRSLSAQRSFINSVLSFMQTYNFDGIDLDWEYPGASDRSGRKEDFASFPKFMENLKKSLKDYEVSITLPASYWYLQHFDIKKLAPHVDFFNMMTYDFHGAWDKPNRWVGPYLNSHTNLTEIKDGLDLLWRNHISPDKVVLGLAFYGRGFTVSSPTCLQPGCKYESGSPAQTCSGEISVMLNSEIETIIAQRSVKPTLNKEAAVQVLTFDNNWVTYDDAETFQMKVDFARSQCLGGVMIWALSHDTEDAKYSRAIGRVAPRKYHPFTADSAEDSGYKYNETYISQCRWTNCNENCPSNWIRMLRSDPGAGKQEYMVDGSGCDGYGAHKLCCPPDKKVPVCGWYTHNNGKCDNACPAGNHEIGSNNRYCKPEGGALGKVGVKTYQAACCTTDVESMKLYDQCSWTNWPQCSTGICSDDIIAYSSTGSGDALCAEWRSFGGHDENKMKYCCKQPDKNQRWSGCEWHSGLSSSGSSFPSNFCHANCPEGDVRVAMDHFGCSGGSAKARCCKPDYKTVTKQFSNSDDTLWETSLKGFLEDATCRSSNIYDIDPIPQLKPVTLRKKPQGLDTASESTSARKDPQLRWQQESATIYLAQVLFWGSPRQATISLWDGAIQVSTYNSLSYANIVDYMRNRGRALFNSLGSTQGPRYLICNLAALNEIINKGGGGGGSGTTNCTCVRDDCCDPENEVCTKHDPEQGEHSEHAKLRLKRGAAAPYKWNPMDPVTGRTARLDWIAPSYPSPGELDLARDSNRLQEAWTYDQTNCAAYKPVKVSLVVNGNIQSSGYQNDHGIERQMLRLWGDDALLGRLRDAESSDFILNGNYYRVPFNYFEISLQQVFSAAGKASERIMDALGSKTNRDAMTLMIQDMNLKKEKMWTNKEEVIAPKQMENWTYGTKTTAANPAKAIEEIRRVLTTYFWHHERNPLNRIKSSCRTIRQILREAENWHYQRFNVRVHAVDHFDAWFQTHLETMRDAVGKSCVQYLENLEALPSVKGNAIQAALVSNMKATAKNLPDIDTTGFFP